MEDIRPWGPEFGPEGKHFVSGNSLFFIFGGAAKLRWGGAQRPFVMFISQKRRVRAAHGRARADQNPLVELKKARVYFGGFFAKLGYFAGFSLYIINFPVRISEAAVGGAGDIIFHNLGTQ